MKSKVAVIMPAYNSAEYISEAIESVLAQTMSDFQLVVVNDGSTDATETIIRGYLDDPRVTLFSQQNAGPSAARNLGISLSDSPYVTLIDSDDRYEPDYLEHMIGRLESDPSLAFCCCDAILFGDTGGPVRRVNGDKPLPAITLENVLSREFQVHGSAAMRREWLEKVGGFNAERRSAEDLDIWVRMLCEGARGAYVDRALCWYRRRDGSLSTDTMLLHSSGIEMYEEVLSRRISPQIDAICKREIARTRHLSSVFLAKAALRAGQHRKFLAAADEARRHGHNWKLGFASILVRNVPALAVVFSGRGVSGIFDSVRQRVVSATSGLAARRTRIIGITLASTLALSSCANETTNSTLPVTAETSTSGIIR